MSDTGYLERCLMWFIPSMPTYVYMEGREDHMYSIVLGEILCVHSFGNQKVELRQMEQSLFCSYIMHSL